MLKGTLILSGPDIEKLITMPAALRIAKQAFTAYGQGKIQMPAKIYLRLDKYQGDFRAMPAYLEGVEACGMKWVNVHPQNKKHGLPSVMSLIIINDPKTGLPLAVMDGTYITNLRTGAAGGIAAKYLARENSSRIALVGCGAQAQTQLMALNEIFDIETVFLYDCLKSQPEIFLKKMRYLDLKMSAAKNIPDCLKNADIVVTTTPSRKPIVKPQWIKNGTHINAIGADAPGKEELETGILKKAKVVVDDRRRVMLEKIFKGLSFCSVLFLLEPRISSADTKYETAAFAGGCFWCMEAPFDELDGVISVISGYTGATGKPNPTYADYAQKGHLEAIQITYDPAKISYTRLLQGFWRQIDATDSGGQFVDRGP